MENTAGANAPRTETEGVLLQLWASVLRVDRVGIYDDFLALGGDSLSALRCINWIREAFGVGLSFDAFFMEPAHIANVAAQIDAMRGEAAEAGNVSRPLPG